jgi:hypothetical protein
MNQLIMILPDEFVDSTMFLIMRKVQTCTENWSLRQIEINGCLNWEVQETQTPMMISIANGVNWSAAS